MKLEDVNNMVRKGLESFDAEQLLEARGVCDDVNATLTTQKKEVTEMKAQVEEELAKKITKGDQVSFDFTELDNFEGKYIGELKDKRVVICKVDPQDLADLLVKNGYASMTKTVPEDAIVKKSILDGSITEEVITDCFEIVEQTELKISKKANK